MKKNNIYSVVFENDLLIAVNKAAGISVGGDRWDESKERLDRLLEKDLKIPKIFTVHRIDKETSGLVVFAKQKEAHRSLSILFENRKVSKLYIAVVHGRPSWKEIKCDLALTPNGNKKHMTIIDRFRGKESVTLFTCVLSAGNYSVLEARPLTGRIHQIRVHAAALGHPVVCDGIYGKISEVKLSSFKRAWRGDPHEEKPLLSRLGLHAKELIIPAASDGAFAAKDNQNGFAPQEKIITAAPPKDISSLIKQMEKVCAIRA